MFSPQCRLLLPWINAPHFARVIPYLFRYSFQYVSVGPIDSALSECIEGELDDGGRMRCLLRFYCYATLRLMQED